MLLGTVPRCTGRAVNRRVDGNTFPAYSEDLGLNLGCRDRERRYKQINSQGRIIQPLTDKQTDD